VILEKLKDPTYAKILLGGPALLLLAISIMFLWSIPWQLVGVIFGLILLIYGFGLHHYMDRITRSIEIRKNKPLNMVVWIMLFVLIIVGITAANAATAQAQDLGFRGLEAWAYISDVLLNVAMIMAFVVGAAKLTDSYFRKNAINQLSAVNFVLMSIAAFLIFKMGAQWITESKNGILFSGYMSFGSFLETSILIIAAAYIVIRYVDGVKTEMLISSIEGGAHVMAEDGSMMGSTVGVEPKEQVIIIKTQLNKIVKVPIEKVVSISQNNDLVIEDY
jgi:hypothetical protein